MGKRLTLNKALDIDVNDFLKLNTKELRQYVRVMADVANKRVKSFDGQEVKPRVINEAVDRGKFSTKGKNLNQLRAEYMRARGFLLNPSSTKKGFAKVMHDTKERLESRGISVDGSALPSFDDVYYRLKETDPGLFATTQGRYQTMETIRDIMNNERDVDIEKILAKVRRRILDIYEETQGEDDVDVSEFFGI